MRKHLINCLMLALILLGVETVDAAPVTYRFKATVGELLPFNSDIGLPFTLVEGSVIDGLLTIDPALNVPPPGPFGSVSEATQPYSVQFSFNGYTFGTEQYRSSVFNDNAIVDGPNPGPADLMSFTCSSTSIDVGCSPTTLHFPGTLPLEFVMRMEFAGNVALLPSPTLPMDIDTWNGFTIERSLNFVFVESALTGASYFAEISDVVAVPEPHASWLLLSLVGLSPRLRRSPT